MHNSGQGRIGIGLEIGGGTGDGAGCGNAHKHGGSNIGNALPDQLGIGIMVIAAHTVDYRCAQQRFNSGQKSNRQRARHHLESQVDIKIRQFGLGQKMRHAAELVANRINIYAEKRKHRHQQRGTDNADQIGRIFGLFPFDQKNGGKGKNGNKQRCKSKGIKIGKINFPLLQKIGRDRINLQPQQVFNLG